jgi:predicted nucleic acid-binding protein
MRYVFDSSALLNIVRALGEDSLKYIRGSYISTLTLYEVGSALWKEATLLNRLSIEEALSLLGAIKNMYRVLRIVEPRDILLTLNLAYRLKITYYDSSYIITAYEMNADLVTDDEKLKKRVKENRNILLELLGKEIAIYSSRDLIKS